MEAEVEEQTEFKLSELSPEARQRAIDKRAEQRAGWWDENDYAGVYEDAIARLGELGFDVDVDNKAKPDVEWSGFYSQGDGLVFPAYWRAKDMRVDQLYANIGDIESSDEDLRAIAARLLAMFLRYPNAQVRISVQHHGPGLGFMQWDDAVPDTSTDDGMNDGLCDELGKEVLECAKKLADWWYSQLESEYEYYCSEEATIEDIEANELSFDEEGDQQ